jgi:hypothetical protein
MRHERGANADSPVRPGICGPRGPKEGVSRVVAIVQAVRAGQIHSPGQGRGLHDEITELGLRDRQTLYDGLVSLVGREATRAVFGEWSPLPEDVPAFKKASELRMT